MADSEPPTPNVALQLWEALRLGMIRFAQGDFQRIKATDQERAILAAAPRPVTEPLAQDYAAWRRSILLVGSALLLVASIFAVVGFQLSESQIVDSVLDANPNASETEARKSIRQNFGVSNLETLDYLMWLELAILVFTTALTMWAAWKWAHVRASRRLARRAWYFWVGVPVLIALVPWSSLLNFDHLGAAHAGQIKASLSVALGMAITIMLAPKIFSIFPGATRSALILKTLVPETSLPAWLAAFCAPIYMLVLVLGIAAINQTSGNALLFFAVLCLVLAPFSYLRYMRSLLRPLDGPTAAERVRRARGLGYILNGIGGLLGLIFLLQLDTISWDVALKMIVTIIGGLMLMMVVTNDFLLAILRVSYQQSAELYGTEMAQRLETKLNALNSGGLTDLRTPAKTSPIERPTPEAGSGSGSGD